MAESYGYGGEFSSDEDIDKIDQQPDRLITSKFDAFAQAKPNRQQIEEALETIRRAPIEQDIRLSDELLAGILDYYKTSRGPIVDSTRNLYKKIVLRLVRNDLQHGNGTEKGSNGNDNNIIISNNNNNNVVSKESVQTAETFSSDDEDEEMPQVDLGSKKKFDGRVVAEPMEVDAEPASDRVHRDNKDNSEDENSEEAEATDESDDSEELDVTPVKPQSNQILGPTPRATSTPLSSVRRQISAKEASKESSIKKPYTRSQRVAATRATSGAQSTKETSKVVGGKVDAATSEEALPSRGRLSLNYKYILVALIVALIAFSIFYFKSDVLSTTDRLLSRTKINF